MFGFIRNFMEEMESNNSIMLFKEDMEKYGEKNKCKSIAVESEEMTLYHLTPKDLGKEIILEPKETDSCEKYLSNSGLEFECRQFKAISFSDTVSHCLIRMPEDKLLSYSEYYIYRTKTPVKGWYDIIEIEEDHYFYNREYRLFKKTPAIRVGRIKCLHNAHSLVERCTSRNEMLDPLNSIGDDIMLYKETENTYIKP